MSELIVTKEAWPYGLRCMKCDTKIREGDAYSKQLVGILPDESPISEIVCVLCGLGLKDDND